MTLISSFISFKLLNQWLFETLPHEITRTWLPPTFTCHMSRAMRKCVLFNVRTTKAQISLRDQRLCCSLLRQYNISRFYSRNFKSLASFCGCAGRFVSDLVGNFRRHVFSWRGSYANCYKKGCSRDIFIAKLGRVTQYSCLIVSCQTALFSNKVYTRYHSSHFCILYLHDLEQHKCCHRTSYLLKKCWKSWIMTKKLNLESRAITL